MKRTWNLATTLALVAVSAVVAACGGAEDYKRSSSAGGSPDGATSTLNLAAYSTPEVVYEEIIPGFQRSPEGRGVQLKSSYGASGDQSRAVEAGLPADYVSFSIEPDMTRLVDAGLVDKGWQDTPTNGFVTTSLVSFIVREGNPKNIRTWDDLVKPGVEVVTPNPFTSGAAKWNLLGAFAHGGLPFVEKLIKEHIVVQPKSGREALQTFTGGEGDVLLSYEYEYTTAVKKGEEGLELVRPDETLKIDITAATTSEAPEQAKAFLKYVTGVEAQQRFADWGYRPVNETVLQQNKDRFPDPRELKTIEDLGGWEKVNRDLFDVETGSIAKLEEEAGVSTAK
jgi:sulfate transport system substrate-binding protein